MYPKNMKAAQYHTFGQRYLAISFMIAQSAFLCSLFASVVSLRRSFFAVVAFRASFGGFTLADAWVGMGFVVFEFDANAGSLDASFLNGLLAEVNALECISYQAVAHSAVRGAARPPWAKRLGKRRHGDRAAPGSIMAVDPI